MRSVNVAELKNRLSKYLTFAKAGEEVVIRDRNLPVAKLVPFSAEGADDQELVLVAAGEMCLPQRRLALKGLFQSSTGRGCGEEASQTVLLAGGREPNTCRVLDLVRTASVQEELHLRGPAIGQGRRVSWILSSRTFKRCSLNEISRLVFNTSCSDLPAGDGSSMLWSGMCR